MFTGVKINRAKVILLACGTPTRADKTVLELWHVKDCGRIGDKNIMEKMRVLLNMTSVY